MKKVFVLLICVLLLCSVAAVGCSGASKPAGPYDDSGFTGSTNNENKPLDTDDFITVDGSPDEACWSDKNWYTYRYEDVTVSATTVFSDLGFYVGFRIADSHVYAVENRMVWMGASIEIYVDRGDSIKKSLQTFQYRLSALNVVECLNGYVTPEDAWNWKYLPIYGQTKVDGVVNSGQTTGLNAEIFVRWDALGYDYKAVGFTAPETVKIMPVYNQSSGPELTSPRTYWVNNGGNNNSPIEYWLFDKDGYANADAANAMLGEGSFGRGKTPGWDISREADRTVKSTISGEQTIYFKDICAEEYMLTTVMDFDKALKYWKNGDVSDPANFIDDPYPKAGIVLAGNKTLQAFLLDCETANMTAEKARGMFFNKGNPDSRELWSLSDPHSLKDFCDPSDKVRLTGVKRGKYLLVFVGDGTAAKYGGEFVGMIEDPLLIGAASPGLFTMGCAVEFTDYAATDNKELIEERTKDILSTLVLDNKTGGALTSAAAGYKRGDTATVTVKTNNNYKLTSLTVNGRESISQIVGGVLTLTMSEANITVVPTYQRITETKYDVSAAVTVTSGAVDFRFVEVFVSDGKNIFNRYLLETDGSLAMSLPDGNYTYILTLSGIQRAKAVFTVAGTALDLGAIQITGNVEFDSPENVVYHGDGSVSVTGENVNKTIKGLTAADNWFIQTTLKRNDGNFIVEGTWSTGGVVVKINGQHYRFFIMRENTNTVVLYLNRQEGHKNKEFRLSYHYGGTGAPINMLLVFSGGEINVLLDGTKSLNIKLSDCGNDFTDLFSATSSKELGFMVVDKVNGGIGFSDFSYSVDAEEVANKLGTFRYTVTLPQNPVGGTVTGDVTSVFIGGAATLRIAANDGYTLTRLEVNGADKLGGLVGGVLTVSNIQENITVAVEFTKTVGYEVSGTFDYADGLYRADDVVSVTAGAASGTATENTFRISLPNGSHTVVLTDKYHQNVTIDVTVSGGAVSGLTGRFMYPKFDSAGSDIDYLPDGSATVFGAHNFKPFSGVSTDGAFVFSTKLERQDGNLAVAGYWTTAGLAIEAGDTVYRLFPMMENGHLVIWYNIAGNDSVKIDFLEMPYLGTGSEIELKVVFANHKLYFSVDNRFSCILDKSNTDSEHGTLKALFDYSGSVRFGVMTVDGLGADEGYKFWDCGYEIGDQAAEREIQSMSGLPGPAQKNQ